MLMLLAALAAPLETITVHPSPTATTSHLTDAEYRRYVTESRQLDACRVRESDHLDTLDLYRARVLEGHELVLACTAIAEETDATVLAQVDELAAKLTRSERRRARLRLALVAVGSALVGVAVWEGLR